MFKVSVIITTYKNEATIERAIMSCVNQTLDNVEIIVVNDGSPQDDQIIINRLMEQYPEKVFGYQKKNGGSAAARNYGLERVHGEYFTFLDGDDWIEPDMYETMYNKAKENDSDYAYCGFYIDYPDHTDTFIEPKYDNPHDMLMNIYSVMWNRLYKTSFIKGLNLKLLEGCGYEDVGILHRIAPFINNYCYVDRYFVHYVQSSTSMTAQNRQNKEIVNVWKDIYQFYKDHGVYDQYHEELEYLTVKYMLGEPFRKCCKIRNKEIRKTALQQLWSNLNDNFPDWHSNKLLKEKHDAKHYYFRTVNSLTYSLYSFVFSKLS